MSKRILVHINVSVPRTSCTVEVDTDADIGDAAEKLIEEFVAEHVSWSWEDEEEEE